MNVIFAAFVEFMQRFDESYKIFLYRVVLGVSQKLNVVIFFNFCIRIFFKWKLLGRSFPSHIIIYLNF